MLPLQGLFTRNTEEIAAESATNPYDCIVIGGGTSGLMFASELGKASKRVALIEAGPLALLNHVNNTELRYSAELTRALQRKLEYSPKTTEGTTFGRFVSCLGGRGLFWNGAAPRFAPVNFKNWAITYEMLEDCYKVAEELFGVSTKLATTSLTDFLCRTLRSKGIKAEPGPFAMDAQPNQNGIIGGTVGNGIAAFMKQRIYAAATNTIQIATESFTNKILVNDAKNKAEGVSVTNTAAGTTHTIFGKAVVLAAGAFESTRLVLNSDLTTSDLAGRYISEHIFCRGYFPVPAAYYNNKAEMAIVWIPATDTQLYQQEIHMPGNRLFRMRNIDDWKPDTTANYAAMIRSFGSVTPNPENRIITTSENGVGAYTVQMKYNEQDEALKQTMIAGIEKVRQQLNLDQANIDALPPGSSYHECGGLRMGTNESNGICDAHGKFFSIPNLISSDAASWPDIPPANPHLTLAALSIFKARHFIEQS